MKIQKSIDIYSLIQKIKDEGKIFPKLKCVSPYGIHISVAASVLSAVGLILAVKDGKGGNFMSIGQPWSSEGHVNAKKSWVVPGLQNLGNNCFLNVILQALASCSSFQRYLEKILEEYEFSSTKGSANKIPLTSVLASLMEELCIVQHKKSVLNPRKVMVAMEQCMPSFSFNSQQDAEEAFFHLLSSLREELSGCYIPDYSSLAEVTTLFNFRFLTPGRSGKESEHLRWKRSFLGPFDGILGSIFTCQSCSFQISLDCQLFHSLHLSPMLHAGGTVMTGCSVEDCLKQFFVSERLENYFCNHCWHVAAIKYLSLLGENEADIEMLHQCNIDESCQCKNIFSVRALPWSNSFSRSFKQFSIVRSPQILCIHLQRASVNVSGELVKLLGHISFPLILDLSPFIKSDVGIKNLEENSQNGQRQLVYQLPFPLMDHPNMQLDTRSRNCGQQTERHISLEAEILEHQQPAFGLPNNVHALKLPENGKYADSLMSFMPASYSNKAIGSSTSPPSRDHMYRLVSVVEHFGKVGSGHYTVYRRVIAETSDEDPVALLEPAHAHWFCISDAEVHSVSEEEVLDADASLLFYEKMFYE